VNAIDLTMPAGIAHAPAGPNQQKIEKSSQEFEGMLMSALWKSMGEDMKDSLGDEDSTGQSFVDMGLQAVGSAMAKSGGVGIGHMLLKALEKQQATEAAQGHDPK